MRKQTRKIALPIRIIGNLRAAIVRKTGTLTCKLRGGVAISLQANEHVDYPYILGYTPDATGMSRLWAYRSRWEAQLAFFLADGKRVPLLWDYEHESQLVKRSDRTTFRDLRVSAWFTSHFAGLVCTYSAADFIAADHNLYYY